jgi:hypothetical protein
VAERPGRALESAELDPAGRDRPPCAAESRAPTPLLHRPLHLRIDVPPPRGRWRCCVASNRSPGSSSRLSSRTPSTPTLLGTEPEGMGHCRLPGQSSLPPPPPEVHPLRQRTRTHRQCPARLVPLRQLRDQLHRTRLTLGEPIVPQPVKTGYGHSARPGWRGAQTSGACARTQAHPTQARPRTPPKARRIGAGSGATAGAVR